MSDQVDRTIERVFFYHDASETPSKCPRCTTSLVLDKGPYLIWTLEDGQIGDDLLISGEFGYLCPNCATAVIHVQPLMKILKSSSSSDWDIREGFSVIGLVNLDAIPPDQYDTPLEELEDFPLVPFTIPASLTKKRLPHSKKPRRPKRRRRR